MSLLLATLTGCSPSTPDAGIQRAIQQGDQVLLALNEYFETNAVYPTKLDDLVPDFLESIPEVRNGHPWQYESRKGGINFFLGYDWGRNGYQIYIYGDGTTITGEWTVDTK